MISDCLDAICFFLEKSRAYKIVKSTTVWTLLLTLMFGLTMIQ